MWAFYESVFHRVVVDVVEVLVEIVVVADHMFPELWLPYTSAAVAQFAFAD